MPLLHLLLIDDHALFRSGLRLVLLQGMADVEVSEAASLEQAVRTTDEPPALVLLDIQLQGVNGLEGLGLLRQRWPQVPVVMLSSIATPDTIAQALARGAAAFVSKGDTPDKIIAVIRHTLAPPLTSSPPIKPSVPRLTPRQCEVLDLLCEGLPNKLIARRLQVSEFTVRGHVQAVLGLLGVNSRSQATFAARQNGLIG
ncbi:response regulator transcription factor [Variovorax sp. ZT5P49]|uniref:response regulator transcription factor n=1 Tax=Variovorax sp. ZT5P49 TaxID=3443733 RepID=UPI003F48B7A5